ncbi:hypothetical protein B0T16DRAFT_350452 [Cercophora newfieldiana]|uniref:Hemerythrin-like domain-containing protein n=1 Tax=Cercophora newfieldiana TaxID=92897 RepID=A0AA40CT06_9PEZI|nr:hypothetical protein B0T16DRAFT_350452 [Cercophora newfieldiana]
MPSPIYADHPFKMMATPTHTKSQNSSAGEPDIFDALASDMTLIHNVIGRGLNSITLQAPHILPADQKSFLSYIRAWHQLVRVHHKNEETDFFPAVEAMAGEKGIMDGNVEQHHAFEGGLEKFREYIDRVERGEEEYDGGKVVRLIEGFGGVLMRHLEDEIETLLGLRRFGEGKMAGILEKTAEEAEKGMKEVGFGGMVWIWAHLDVEFEGGRWVDWPPAPGPMKFLVANVFWRVYGGMAKFGAVDSQGRMRPLYALGKQ